MISCLFWTLLLAFIFGFSWLIIEPVTGWGWVGTLTLTGITFFFVMVFLLELGYRIKALFLSDIRQDRLEEKGHEICEALQNALRNDDLTLLRNLFTNEALTQLASLPRENVEALRDAWFPRDEKLAVTPSFDDAKLVLTSVPRRIGDPAVTLKLTYAYHVKTDPVTAIEVEVQRPGGEAKGEEKAQEG